MICLIVWPVVASAADQTETIKARPKVLETADSYVNVTEATLTYVAVDANGKPRPVHP